MPPGGGAAFLAPLPVSRLWGVGPKSARALATDGPRDRRRHRRGSDPEALVRKLGPSGRDLWEQANAIDPRPVIPDREAKSIGAEDTFDEDLTGVAALSPRVHAQALRVGRRLRARGPARADGAAEVEARRLHAGDPARDAGRSRPTTASCCTGRRRRCSPREPARPTRLTGVSAQNLVAADAPQLGLFAPPPTSRAGAQPRPRRDRRPLRRRQRHDRGRRRRSGSELMELDLGRRPCPSCRVAHAAALLAGSPASGRPRRPVRAPGELRYARSFR